MKTTTDSITINAAGRRLALTRQGSGTPPVVLETGLGAESAEWEVVQQAIAPLTQVCRYDRANRGQSDPAPQPRSAQDCVDDLHALLVAAEIPRPVILVGHSLGGLIVRLYAYQYPAEVAGLVLVDPMHVDQFDRFGPLIPPAFPGEPAELTNFRRFWTADWRDPSKNQEGIDLVASQEQGHTIDSLGDIPLLLLTAGSQMRDMRVDAAHAASIQALGRELQGEMLRQSSNAQQIVVESSGHFIQREQPEVIVAAIQQLLQTVAAQ